MALKLPSFKFFSNADAKSRIFMIFAGLIVFSFIIYMAIRFLGGNEATTGASQIASAPSGLQSVPGAKMSPEFYRAVMQANQQAAQQAQISGGSAVPTLVNIPAQQAAFSPAQTGSCTVLCSDEAVNVADSLNDLVKAGKLSQDDANKLSDLAKRNVSVDEYAAALDQLVREGKLTPEQARKLLADYKKQYQNGLSNESAQAMDALIKSGQLPLDVANQLLALQKSNASPADYAAELNALVKDGRISSALSSQLLGQYTQQRAKQAAKDSDFKLRQMAKGGEITPDVAQTLASLQNRGVSVDDYNGQIDQLVAAGKMTPAAAAKLKDQYKTQRAAIGAMGSLNSMLNQENANTVTQLSDLLKNGKIPPDIANGLFALMQKNIDPDSYQKVLDDYVKQGKLSPEDAKALALQYQKLAALRGVAGKLSDLQGNNASLADYTAALKQGVQSGVISADMAAGLLQEYKGIVSPGVAPTIETTIPGTENFAKLQQRLADQGVPQETTADVDAFDAAAAQASEQAAEARQQRIRQLASGMSAQAQSLITNWQAPVMQHQAGAPAATTPGIAGGLPAGGKTRADTDIPNPVLIKAGTILFAILDTAIDSDYPDTPVMATIINGPYKGAKLLGKIALASSPTGVTGNDKVSISFTLMNRDEWQKSRTIKAFAIDPDTARTVMASNVNYHYLLRYGSIFASSFLSGYSSAITQSGSTNSTGIFGTSTTTSPISPGNKIAVGLGKVGDTFTNAVSGYVNTPPTVKVNSGVGLGILFMDDLLTNA